jgi:hypothetical protein
MQAIYERSGGVPRTISAICDNAMVNGFAAEANVIGPDIIREVCDDFDLRVPFSEEAEPAQPAPVVAETKAPPPNTFRLVSLGEIRARRGTPSTGSAAPPSASPGPASVPATDAVDRRAPEIPRAPAVMPTTPVEPLTGIAPYLAAAVAVCVLGLLVVILGIGIRWRRSETPVQVTHSTVAAIADSQVSPLPTSAVVLGSLSTASPSSTATPPPPEVRVEPAPPPVATKSPPAARKTAKVRAERQAKLSTQRDARAKRPAVARGAAGSATPKRSIDAGRPTPDAALAAMTPQPFTRQTTAAAPVQIDQPPAARATAGVPAAAPAAPAVAAPTDEQRILGVLGDYKAAYEQLDPQAVETVWPSVNTRALARAFDGLSSQSIGFDRCDVSVGTATARAACQGDVEYVKRVGGGTQSARREWVFDLQKSEDGAWRIKSLTSR